MSYSDGVSDSAGMASQAVWAFYICQEAQQGQNTI